MICASGSLLNCGFVINTTSALYLQSYYMHVGPETLNRKAVEIKVSSKTNALQHREFVRKSSSRPHMHCRSRTAEEQIDRSGANARGLINYSRLVLWAQQWKGSSSSSIKLCTHCTVLKKEV